MSSGPSARDVRLGRAQLEVHNDPSVTKVVPLGKFPGQMSPPSFGVDAWHSCRPAGAKHEFATGPEDPRLFHWKGKPHLLFVSGDVSFAPKQTNARATSIVVHSCAPPLVCLFHGMGNLGCSLAVMHVFGNYYYYYYTTTTGYSTH